MTRPVLTRVLALLVVGVVAAACGFGTGDPSADPPAATGSPGEDGTMTAAEFKSDIQTATNTAEDYWKARFEESGERFRGVRQVVAYTRDGEVDCAGEPVPRTTAVHSPTGDPSG